MIAASALALVAAEAALRVAGFSYPSFFLPDPVLGIRLRPGMEGWQRDEGAAYVKISSAGLRDRERSLDKPPHTLRIAVLGDSFTEAMQVELERAFPAVLERELESCVALGARRPEVINFGVSNYGTAQQLLLLRSRVWAYAPDIVLLAFFAGNDVRNNSRALERGERRPFFVLQDGALALDASFADDPELRASLAAAERLAPLQSLRLYQLARRARAGTSGLRHDAPIAVALARGGEPPPLSEPGLDENVLREPPDERWREAWQVTEKLLETMHAEVRARGGRFMVATIAPAGAAYPDREARNRYARHLRMPDLFYPERRIARLGSRAGFPVLTLGPLMQRHADARGRPLYGFANAMPGFGHWNEAGHALAGSLLAQFTCEALAGKS